MVVRAKIKVLGDAHLRRLWSDFRPATQARIKLEADHVLDMYLAAFAPLKNLGRPSKSRPATAQPRPRRPPSDPPAALPLPPLDDCPTTALPGSPEKVAVLERRAARGVSLWHPQDAGTRQPGRARRDGSRPGQAARRCGVAPNPTAEKVDVDHEPTDAELVRELLAGETGGTWQTPAGRVTSQGPPAHPVDARGGPARAPRAAWTADGPVGRRKGRENARGQMRGSGGGVLRTCGNRL